MEWQETFCGIAFCSATVLGPVALGVLVYFLLKPPDIERLKAKRKVEKIATALRYKSLGRDKERAETRTKEIRQAAVNALEELGDARAVQPLITALQDAHSLVRAEAAVALGQIGDGRAVEPLIAVAQATMWSRDLRHTAARALATLYRSGQLDEEAKLRILKEKDHLAGDHADRWGSRHTDNPRARFTDCNTGHSDSRSRVHTDRAIGIEL